MFSQQSLPKMINTFPSGNLTLITRWSQVIVVFICILCLVYTEVSVAVAASCAGNQTDNCSPDCNITCFAIACNNGTGDCKNNTTEDQVPRSDQEENAPLAPTQKCEDGTGECNNITEGPVPNSDKEDKAPPSSILKCVDGAGECKINTTEGQVSNPTKEENVSPEKILACEDLEGFVDCDNITTEGEFQITDEDENAAVAIILGCEEGLYGANCSIPCPANCVGPTCDHVTGDCSSGCRIGYQGLQCVEACPKGYHGHGCKNPCPDNCATSECHHENGYCLTGCKGDYWGSDCSLLGEFKDNPEPAQEQFYIHLSAESKSILLYLLMGKYEETLERAQLEINRGLQLRNKLRAVMGS